MNLSLEHTEEECITTNCKKYTDDSKPCCTSIYQFFKIQTNENSDIF